MTVLRTGPVVGLGVDVVELDRFREVLQRTPSLVERVFTPGEQAYARARTDPTERFAVRFAAKEAVLKSLGLGLGALPFVTIEVVRSASGVPGLSLHGEAAEVAARHGVDHWALTLTHTHRSAQALAVAFGPPTMLGETGGGGALRLELVAGDVNRTVAFYEAVLGFTAVRDDTTYVSLRAGDAVIGVAAAPGPAPGGPPHPAARRPGQGIKVVLEVDDVDAAWRRAARHLPGLGPPETRPSGSRGFGVVDPDGVYVQVIDRPARLAP